LGWTYFKLGQFDKAQEMYHKRYFEVLEFGVTNVSLEIREKLLGKEHYDIARSLGLW
jgi:hypothetical protein